MKGSPPSSDERPLRVWDLFLASLSLMVILGVALDLVLELDRTTKDLILVVDSAVCLVFLSDFVWRLATAKDRAAYLKWGWVDLISSIPVVETLRWGRLLQVFRVLRAIRSARHLMRLARRGQAFTVLLAVALGCFVLALAGSMAMLHFEKNAPGTTIHSLQDAFWWSLVTMATVGYGDCYPVTGPGRIVAVVLMFTGIGLFGTLTAFLSTRLLRPALKEEEKELSEVLAKLEALEKKIDALQSRATHGKEEGMG
jgi:voltage-gated potassium channel